MAHIAYCAFMGATAFWTSLILALVDDEGGVNVWTKANEIMKDIYSQILLISMIAAIVTAAFVVLLIMNFSRSGRTVDESRAWLK